MSELMTRSPLFDPTATDDNLKIWNGKTTNLMNLEVPAFGWAKQLYEQMRSKFWIPQRIDLTGDISDYKDLTDSERIAFNGILAYLIYLDSIQESMLPSIGDVMTAPAVRHCINEQTYFEGIHSESYKYIVETLMPVQERNVVYEFWRTDKILSERCQHILGYYQKYLDTRSNEDYFYALFADYLLEGLYFYNGFQFFFTLASRQKMNNCADIIKLIARDELEHVRLFQKLLEEGSKEFVFSVDKLLEMTDYAVKKEVEFTGHITRNDCLGITENSTEQYTKYLANLRLRAIGITPIYEDVKSPYKHLEKIGDTENDAGTRANFFEVQTTSYVMSSTVDGWDFEP